MALKKSKQELETSRKKLGQVLKGSRKLQKISVYKLCKDVGLSPEQVRTIEEGTKNYTIDSYLAYSEYLLSRIKKRLTKS